MLAGVLALALVGTGAAVAVSRSGDRATASPSSAAAPAVTSAPAPAGSAARPLTGPSSAPSSAAPSTPVSTWHDQVLRDFSPLAQSSFSAVRTITEWNLGRATATDVRTRVQVALTTSQETIASLAARRPLPGTETALTQYRAGADLYIGSLQTVLNATYLTPGGLQTQVRRAAARQRDLGDRLYDLAQSSLAPLLPAQPDFDGVEFQKPPEVPDYDAIDLGVGPPLASAQPAPGPVRTFQAKRPEQSAQAWVRQLEQLQFPTTDELLRQLQSGSAARLGETAQRLVLDSDELNDLPDPEGHRNVSTQVQLGLLVEADALRTAQAATLAPAAQRLGLRQAAAGLGRIGTSLVSARP